MIDFLKESTFAVNDVVNKSWEILYKNYKNIAGLCFTMFIILWMSGFLSSFVIKGEKELLVPFLLMSGFSTSFVSNGIIVLNIFIFLFFIIIYSGLQLTLFKYLLFSMTVAGGDEETFTHKFITFLKQDALKLILAIVAPLIFISFMAVLSEVLDVNALLLQVLTVVIGFVIIIFIFWNQIKPFFFTIKDFWPTNVQLFNFTLAMLCALAVTLLTFIACAALLFPLVYVVDIEQLVNIAVPIGGLIAMMVLIRISFFPFFIISLDANPF
ncbi:MAG TPA: hypothetical protein DIT07_03910, partial [Sphingobacteriaceae bacterium]|nr:hypothetical protein [Sphingobacteriaceae bacterium]